MSDTLLSARDMDFLLYDWIGLEDRLKKVDHLDRGSADAYFDLSRKLAEEEFLSHYKQSDITEPWMDEDGRYGYTRDFDVEQLYRDNRLNAIHEGTTGIQSQDLLGRKILRNDGAGLVALKNRAVVTIKSAKEHSALCGFADELQVALDQLDSAVEALMVIEPKTQLDNSGPFFRAFCVVVVAWQWLDQAVCVSKLQSEKADQRNFALGKLAACRYFFECELTIALPLLKIVTDGSGVASAISPDYF